MRPWLGYGSAMRIAKRSGAALALTLLLPVLSCAKRPDAMDAKGALTTLEAIAAATPDASTGLRLRYQSCSELPGCAAGCAEDLKFCAGRDTEEAQRGAVLGKCFPEAAKAASADVWFRGALRRISRRFTPAPRRR